MASSQNGPTSSSSPQSWEELLDLGYRRYHDSWKAERSQLLATKEKDPKALAQWKKRCILSREGGWDNMSVVNAIATIWAPLGMRHGYGVAQVFEIRDRDTQTDWLRLGSGQLSTACGQYEEKFIIPLHLMSVQQKQTMNEIGENKSEVSSNRDKGKDKAQSSPGRQAIPKNTSKAVPFGERRVDPGSKSQTVNATAKTKGKAKIRTEDEETIGHLVLAVATKDGSKPITIQIWDSCPGRVARAEIEEAARGVVRYSGWMGMSLNSRVWDRKPPPVFRRTAFEKTPRQGNGNFCGLYTVLNAWANMLGIQIRRQGELKLPEGETLENFQRMATNIINLALAGHMDSRTIQAFLKVYGYSAGQSLDKLVRDVRAIKMDDMILNNYVVDKKAFDDVITQQVSEPYAGPWLL